MGDKKLTPVCTWTGICHRQFPRRVVPKVSMEFVSKIVSRSACTGTEWASTLNHKRAYDTVEIQTIVVTFACQVCKVGDSHWCFFREKVDVNRALGCFYICCDIQN